MQKLLLAILLAVASTAGHAQYYNNLSGRQFSSMYAVNADRLMSQMTQQSGWNAMRASIEAQAKKAPAAASTPPRPPVSKRKLPLASTDFRPAGPRSVPEQLAAHATNPKDREDIVNAGRQLHSAIEATPGFRKDNLASALAVLVGVSVQVIGGHEISDEETDDLVYGINDEMANLEAFKSMPADQRTQAYDTFIVVGGFIASIFQAGNETRNKALVDQARAMARDALSKLGVKA